MKLGFSLKIMRNIIKIIWVVGVCHFVSGVSAQNVRTRIDALEKDSVYMSLLSKEEGLKISEDSLLSVVRTQRASLRSDTTNIYKRSQEILRAEETIFDIRTQLGVVASRINEIEQRHILSNLFSQSGTSPEGKTTARSTDYPNLTDNAYFKDNLTPEEYAELKETEANRAEISRLITAYKQAYEELRIVAEDYSGAMLQSASDSLYMVYRGKLSDIHRLESDFKKAWGEGFNQEVYLYSYLLDKLNRMNDLSALNEKLRAGRQQAAEEVMSEVFAEYPFQRELILDYQSALAKALSLTAASDSLARVRRSLENENLAFPAIQVAEKEFVAFEDVSFPTQSPYTAENPIPEIWIPESGTYYSVTVGTFSQRQAVSVFRGAVPVYYERLSGSQWRYYVGLFRSYDDAATTVNKLKNAGFRRPEPVRWRNGKYENLVAETDKNEGLYRIRIETPGGELGENVRILLDRYARSKEITRAGSVFYVGTFTNKIHAGDVMEALRKMEGIQIEIENIEE